MFRFCACHVSYLQVDITNRINSSAYRLTCIYFIFIRKVAIREPLTGNRSIYSITCVRLCDLEPEQECSEHADCIRYVLKNNKKTEQS